MKKFALAQRVVFGLAVAATVAAPMAASARDGWGHGNGDRRGYDRGHDRGYGNRGYDNRAMANARGRRGDVFATPLITGLRE